MNKSDNFALIYIAYNINNFEIFLYESSDIIEDYINREYEILRTVHFNLFYTRNILNPRDVYKRWRENSLSLTCCIIITV